MKTLLFAIFLAPSVAFGAADTTKAIPELNSSSTNTYNIIETVALNASAANRTITVDLDGDNTMPLYSKLKVTVIFTDANSSETFLTMTPTCSEDGTNYASPTTRSCALGVCKLYPISDKRPVSGSENFQIEYDVQGCRSFKVVTAGTGAAAADTISVQATKIVGG